MTRLKESFKLRIIASTIYYAVLFFAVRRFAPEFFSWFKAFISNFSLGVSAIFLILAMFIGASIIAYAIIIPLAFFDKGYEDESFEQL